MYPKHAYWSYTKTIIYNFMEILMYVARVYSSSNRHGQCMLRVSVGRYTENTGYQGIEINTASFLQIPKYCDRN